MAGSNVKRKMEKNLVSKRTAKTRSTRGTQNLSKVKKIKSEPIQEVKPLVLSSSKTRFLFNQFNQNTQDQMPIEI